MSCKNQHTILLVCPCILCSTTHCQSMHRCQTVLSSSTVLDMFSLLEWNRLLVASQQTCMHGFHGTIIRKSIIHAISMEEITRV